MMLPKARWRRSSYSNANGGACVEVAATSWRRSTHSNTNGGNCVEVADGLPGVVPIRDSKNPGGPMLTVPTPVWDTFISSLKA
ncbi:DUF397 domain-containing protein [Streptomyces acidiscabies]|uniref:DUF397 domain-containing protein n=1 Tax=Streptomyces acidiscabies TaxID=42234 RepID=UPI00073F4F70|nr:DUF397 domain-containing protein [Streptomyces acidiscabies]GAQ54135.1 hypothetical protein a10_03940 [Streptomyces acidiscabies]GAV40985.1 hypothetical protein Saa2_03885 [Streptomyces acidiscabies]